MSQIDPSDTVRAPGLVMTLTGAVNLLFWLAWSSYALFIVLMQGGFAALAVAMESDGDLFVHLFSALWSVAIQGCNGFIGLFLALGAVASILGGLRLRALRSKGLVYLGVALLILSPLISILTGVLTAMASFNCCGLLFGQLPTLILFFLNLAVSIFVIVVLGKPEVAEGFQQSA